MQNDLPQHIKESKPVSSGSNLDGETIPTQADARDRADSASTSLKNDNLGQANQLFQKPELAQTLMLMQHLQSKDRPMGEQGRHMG